MLSAPIRASQFRPLKDKVFVRDLDSGARKTSGGILLPDDDMRDTGIRDRWGCVYAVGPEITDLVPGQWVLLKHGRWTPGIDLMTPEGRVRIWGVEYPDAVLLVSDDDPRDARPTTL